MKKVQYIFELIRTNKLRCIELSYGKKGLEMGPFPVQVLPNLQNSLF